MPGRGQGAGKTILLIGGARSGKSFYAQELALQLGGPVLFVATGEPGDEEMLRRIEEHRKARPASWRTLEAPVDLARRIGLSAGECRVVVVDCITLLLSNIFSPYGDDVVEPGNAQLVEERLMAEVEGLVDCARGSSATFIIITNEVGEGLVPVSPMGRLYRDLLGRANQVLASHSDEVYLMVAGLPVLLKPQGT